MQRVTPGGAAHGVSMTDSSLVLATILVPALGALLLPLVGMKSPKLRNLLAAALVLAAFLANAALFPSVFLGAERQVITSSLLGMRVAADGLAVFVGATASLVSFIIVIYSFDYISAHHAHDVHVAAHEVSAATPERVEVVDHSNEYYTLVVLFLGSMMGLVYSGNLLLLFVFWELTALASWRLIGYFRKPLDVVRANKAFLTTVFGALLMLLGFVMLWQQTGSFDLLEIRRQLGTSPVEDVAFLLILAGILSKSATLPFHTWLPDAGVAPSPVTSLLHAAVLVKIGVYVFARLFIATLTYTPFCHEVVLVIAAASALVSAGGAFIHTDLKRIIAYSTVSQIAFIFLGLAAGSHTAVTGALLYILMHGLAKGGLFLCAGIIEQGTHTRDITKLGGLKQQMPVTAVAFLLCAFSVMGVPPFGGFFSKSMVLAGAAEAGYPWITSVFVVGAFLTIIYLFRLYNRVFLGPVGLDSEPEGSRTMVYSVAALALLSLVGGLAIHWPGMFAEVAVDQMLGVVK
jgi:NADH:ubiquinone oxidoreductase subunit 5 (subunit L)/multisubunit Na+/H+ antiporter MnhA subunit